MSRIGIAVKLTGRIEQKTPDVALAVKVKKRTQAPYIRIKCFDGILSIEGRRGYRSHMNDEIGLLSSSHTGDTVFDDIKALQLKARSPVHQA